MELVVRILPEDDKKWYPAECGNCGWVGSSENMDGGSQIADTGCYTDPLCPCCGSTDVDETENIQPMTGWIDRLYKSGEVIKKLNQTIDSLRFPNPLNPQK